MMKENKKIFLFWGIVFVFFLWAGHALALELQYPTIFGLPLNDTSTLPDYGCYLIGLGMSLAFFITVISIAFGGVYYLISYGRGKFTDEGKDWIKSGVSGLLIVACAFLILYTINHNLTACSLQFVPGLNISTSVSGNFTLPPGAATYQEIPMGTLTENLLTRTMSCYEFDLKGDPVDYATVDSGASPLTDDNGKTYSSPEYFIPTYLDHDRADCLLQLTDGAQKTAQVIANLSDEIISLMQECDCAKYGECGDTCGGQDGCDDPANVQPDGSCIPMPQGVQALCTGKCVGAACAQADNGPKDCCPEGVKDKIEHGPIDVGAGCEESSNAAFYKTPPKNNFATIATAGISNIFTKNNFLTAVAPADNNNGGKCDNQNDQYEYNGLDEFRCPQCQPGEEGCLTDKKCSDAVSKCSYDEISSYVETSIQINKKTVDIIDQQKWDCLNLYQQETYFKGKIDNWAQDSKIQADVDKLDEARDTLSKCYLAMPYVDLLKTFKSTNQQQHIVTIQKTFTDPGTNQIIDASKYCKGFNYNNSDCLKKCNDMCPDTSDQAVQCYGSCTDPKTQETCIENCYNSRPCTNASGNNPPKIFSDCISSCQDDCQTDCCNKYLAGSDGYAICQSQCKDNSQCVLNNAGDCLFGAQGFANCASPSQITDPGNTKNCIDNAYLCKNGSNEYAGYQDCVEPNANSSDSGKCSENGYSSSFLYDHQECQKCPSPYDSPQEGSVCYNSNGGDESCQDLCPETTKCLAASNCPDCPCNQIDQTFNFSVPNESNGDNSGDEGCGTQEQKISANEITSPQCNEYSYNDDPLTFYCEINPSWWNDPNKEGNSPTPIGAERICSMQGEVPVGQTIDDAENWAKGIIKISNSMSQDLQQLLTQMEKIGTAKDAPNDLNPGPVENYCKCDAQFEDASPICTTDCQYWQKEVCDNEDPPNCEWECGCAFEKCKGSPCDQLIDYLSEIWTYDKQIKLDFIKFYTGGCECADGTLDSDCCSADNNFMGMLQEPRSDIMKELTYSRQQINNCSLVSSAYGSNVSARLFSCTRAEGEICGPAGTDEATTTFNGVTMDGCYGGQTDGHLGKIFNLTDNWFCAEEYQKSPAPRNQPK